MYSLFGKTVSSTLRNIANTKGNTLNRFFAKIANFKKTYPILYEHVHPDSLSLFENEFVDSGTIVKWVCPKGPDHIWESDIASRVRSFKRRKDCILTCF